MLNTQVDLDDDWLPTRLRMLGGDWCCLDCPYEASGCHTVGSWHNLQHSSCFWVLYHHEGMSKLPITMLWLVKCRVDTGISNTEHGTWKGEPKTNYHMCQSSNTIVLLFILKVATISPPIIYVVIMVNLSQPSQNAFSLVKIDNLLTLIFMKLSQKTHCHINTCHEDLQSNIDCILFFCIILISLCSILYSHRP